ncbi:MAG: adenylate/guanylate cyclase domain-containing protein, partial [Chlamydiota bacterium]|nr:adenylate/guanylate cyclase domain-containing protein [Chlamydiota bacterium]
GISLLLSHMITVPLFKLMNGLQKIKEGDLDIRVYVQSGDEIQLLTESFNQMADGLKEREMIKDAFSRYASDQVVQKILQGEVKPVLEGSLRDVTVLFADIRKFTQITNNLSPQQVVQVLNQYFSAMNDIVNKYEGLVDKYTGDEIMAVFGAPLSHSDDPHRAVKTSIDMIGALEDVNDKLDKLHLPTISIGIGIHSGTAIAGNIGSEKRLNYTVIGKDVNIAARIVDLAKENEIYISDACYQKVKNHIQVGQLEQVSLKGLQETFNVFRIVI